MGWDMKQPELICCECDSPLDVAWRGFKKCPECDTPLFIERKRKKLISVSVEKQKERYYNPGLNRRDPHKKRGSNLLRLMGKPISKKKPAGDEIIDALSCMCCSGSLQTSFGSIRSRMLKAMERQVTTQWHDNKAVEFYRYFPTYKVGRLCVSCQKRLTPTLPFRRDDGTISSLPKRDDQYEILQELKNDIKRTSVTVRDIKLMDAALEADTADTKTRYTTRIGLIIKPKPEVVDDTIDPSAFNKYGLNRRDGKRSYDREVEFDNIKKGK